MSWESEWRVALLPVVCAAQVPMWEQLAFAAFLQKHWADNQASPPHLAVPVPSPVSFDLASLLQALLKPSRRSICVESSVDGSGGRAL